MSSASAFAFGIAYIVVVGGFMLLVFILYLRRLFLRRGKNKK